MSETKEYFVGIVSDTHGLLRPELIEIFQHVDLIIHAGDFDKLKILEKLKTFAPVVAVRGNMDKNNWADSLNFIEAVEFRDIGFYVLHDLSQLDLDPGAAGFDFVISGHTHLISIEKKDNVTYINPGSAGPQRLNLPVTCVLLRIKGASVEIETIKFIT